MKTGRWYDHTLSEWLRAKRCEISNMSESVEYLEPSGIAGGHVQCYNCFERPCGCLSVVGRILRGTPRFLFPTVDVLYNLLPQVRQCGVGL